jgi:hypothetical protein
MEKQRIAVIQPAGKIFDRTYTEAILPIATTLNADLTRVPTDLHQQLPSALDTLKSAQTIIADLTGLNPHIMFLTGCARALDKPIHFLTQHAETFPFESAPIVYTADLAQLRTDLISILTSLSSQTNETNSAPAENPRAKFLSIFGDLLQKHSHEHRGPILQDEPTVFTLLEQDMDLPLVQDIARRARELGLRVRLM